MFDFKFDWNNDFVTGVEAIDEQHKELLRIGRDIEQLLIIQCIGVEQESLLNIIRELREYVSYHFYEEEQIMLKYGYSKFEEHKKEHEKFNKLIQNIDIPKLGTNPYEVLKVVKSEIQDYIFAHMLITDKQMVKELNKG